MLYVCMTANVLTMFYVVIIQDKVNVDIPSIRLVSQFI